MSVLNQSGEEQVECPLCLEPLEVDDLNFFPCTCGYQICRFCWHRIRTDENGLCPACRKAYSENPADFKPLSQEEVARLKAEKRHKDQQRKQKITENRKHLANIRVVQRNLVFVVGLPMRLADAEVLKKHEYFGKFGKIQKVVINQSTSYAGSQGPSASAYVTYHKADDALRAIQAVNNISVDGRTIKTSLGTTKYCSHFMKNQTCPKPDCMYLHELGDTEASFTKEEMQQGKHQDYEKKLHEQLLNVYNQTSVSRERKPTPSPPAVASSIANSSNTSNSGASPSSGSSSQSCSKEAWPSLQPGLSVPSSSGSFGMSNSNNNSSNNNISNNIINNNNSTNTGKNEGGQRRHRKTKDKSQNVPQDEVGGSKINTTSRSHQTVQQPTRSSSSSSELASEPANEADSDVPESDENSCTSRPSGNRILPTSHRAVLFEPDNNSFFSTNNFTKVTATAAGSGTTDWPLNGLTLTHMPDVLPPVHSSEDWQAAFGFSNSTNSQNVHHQENSSIDIPSEKQQIELVSKVDSDNNHDDQQSLHFKNIAVSGEEELRLNSSGTGSSFSDEQVHNSVNMGNSSMPAPDSLNSAISSGSTQQIFPQSSYVHQDPILLMHHPQYPVNNIMNHMPGGQHPLTNGLPPTQATSKFLADFHLRQQQTQSQLLRNHSSVLESSNYSSGNLNSMSGKLSIICNSDFNGVECKVNSENEIHNGIDADEENYVPRFLSHQQKNLEVNMETKRQNLLAAAVEGGEEMLSKDNGRVTDDELGFDPFHETQKALAEMIEKESMVSMMNKQSPSHGFHNEHSPVNHLTQHLYQQYHLNHLNHYNHQLPHGSLFGGSKMFNSFNGCSQHILPQQNHRLPGGVSTCTKLLDGLGLGPSSLSSVGPTAPTRTRLPPPGFSTAVPNHMNAFGLGIPRAPSGSTGSKILPFMGLGNSCNSPNNGASSPISQAPQHTFGLQNGLVKPPTDAFSENLRSLLGSHNQGMSVPPPVFHGNTQKGWTGGVGPCTDWTALDPAIVSSSCPHNFLAPTSSNPTLHLVHNSPDSKPPSESSSMPVPMRHLHQLPQGSNSTQWLRSLASEDGGCVFYGANVVGGGSADWASQPQQNHVVGSPNSGSVMMAPPTPPGFSSIRLAKQPNADMGKIESVNHTEEGIILNKEEDRMEDLR